MVKSLFEESNEALRADTNIIVVFRRYQFYVNLFQNRSVTEPVIMCKFSVLRMMTARHRLDSYDLQDVEFYWRFAYTLKDQVLDAVKAHMRFEDEVCDYIHALEKFERANK